LNFSNEVNTESLFTGENIETYNTDPLFAYESTETYGIDYENIDMKYDNDENNENTDKVETMNVEEILKAYEEIADYNENINELNKKYPLINWNLYFEKRLEKSSLSNSIKKLLITANINSDLLDYISNEVDLNDLINYCEW